MTPPGTGPTPAAIPLSSMASSQGRTRSSSNWSMPTINRLNKKWYGSPSLSGGNDMHFKTADVAGLRVFYREAGDPSKPTIVLLHGFPSSSHQFHDLMPRLEDRFHVIAPDYPGMGYSDAPAPTVLRPTFDDIAMAIDEFIAQRTPKPVILYMHDIGGPIGMRI